MKSPNIKGQRKDTRRNERSGWTEKISLGVEGEDFYFLNNIPE